MSPWASGDSLTPSTLNRVVPSWASNATVSVNVRSYGATGDGSTDDAAAIQAALNAVGGTGGTVQFSDGTYSLSTSLKVPSDIVMALTRRATLVRNFASGGLQGATIQNSGLSTGNQNIAFIGGRITNADATANGKHLAMVNVTNLLVDGVRFSGVSADWNMVIQANNAILRGMEILSGTTNSEDGIHLLGGDGIVIADSVISSGDDCIALDADSVTVPSTGSNFYNIAVSNCVLRSQKANGFRVSTSVASWDFRGIALSNCVIKKDSGATGGSGLILRDTTGNRHIRDVAIDNVILNSTANGSSSAVSILNVIRPVLRGVVVTGPLNRGFEVTGTEDALFEACSVVSNQNASQQGWLVQGNTRPRFIGCSAHSITDVGLHLGGTSSVETAPVVTGFLANNCREGLYLRNTLTGLVTGTVLSNNSAGIEEHSDCSGNIIGDVLLSNNTTGVVAFDGTNTLSYNIVGQGARYNFQADSGGTAIPTYTFQSERSLGWFRSGASVMALSYGTLELVRASLSLKTTGTSLTSANVGVNEIAVYVGGASGATLALRSGGTLYYFGSSASTKG